jgi:hypothetical protein
LRFAALRKIWFTRAIKEQGLKMGLFLAVSAFRNVNPREVAQACADYLLSYGVECAARPPDADVDHHTDAMIFQSQEGWLVVLWPEYFGVNVGAAARGMAAEHGWLISTIKVYDGAYWDHLAYLGQEELHSHCSWPNYWDEESQASDWEPDPAKLAAALGVSADVLRPYLIDAGMIQDEAEPRKANADDNFELRNIWVFVDFWRRLGVTYPEPGKNIAQILRITTDGFMDKLPV